MTGWVVGRAVLRQFSVICDLCIVRMRGAKVRESERITWDRNIWDLKEQRIFVRLFALNLSHFGGANRKISFSNCITFCWGLVYNTARLRKTLISRALYHNSALPATKRFNASSYQQQHELLKKKVLAKLAKRESRGVDFRSHASSFFLIVMYTRAFRCADVIQTP